MSFYSGAVARPRKRGRIYLGPLRADTGTTVGNVIRPSTAIRTNVAGAGATLIDLSGVVRWGVLSQADEVIWQIDHGFIDDAFDTQRRRGEDPTARTEFS